MIRTVVSWVAARLDGQADGEDAGGDSGADDSEDGDESGGFLPSRLDASVLTSHGMGTSQATREMADIEEQAQRLEEEHREE